MKYLTLILSYLLITAGLYANAPVRSGAEQLDKWLPLVEGKRIALVANQTSLCGKAHLLDTLVTLKRAPAMLMAPEHGFRGKMDAGATIKDGKDFRTGIPVVSLYGKNKKPTPAQLQSVDAIVFDLQDVGVRFYTYISTLYYVMQACAENGKPLIVLDRPNPCDYVDGPVLDLKFKSFVGMLPIPVLHGLLHRGRAAGRGKGQAGLPEALSADCHTDRRMATRHAVCTACKTVAQPAYSSGHCPVSLSLPVRSDFSQCRKRNLLPVPGHRLSPAPFRKVPFQFHSQVHQRLRHPSLA